MSKFAISEVFFCVYVIVCTNSGWIMRQYKDINAMQIYILMIWHYFDVIMGAMASLNTSLTTVYSTVHSGVDQRKQKSSVSPAFVWGIHRRQMASNAENDDIWWRHHRVLSECATVITFRSAGAFHTNKRCHAITKRLPIAIALPQICLKE